MGGLLAPPPAGPRAGGGYRCTTEHGGQGFPAPTLIPPAGPPSANIARRHLLRAEPYQSYVGQLAQFTAVDLDAAARALAELADSPELRARMGAAGRARVQAMFDWPVVARAYRRLFEDLASARPKPAARRTPRLNPVHGDPFADFADFASLQLGVDTRFGLCPDTDLSTHPAFHAPPVLDGYAAARRWSAAELLPVAEETARGGEIPLGALLSAQPQSRRSRLIYGLVWLCKMGVLRWT